MQKDQWNIRREEEREREKEKKGKKESTTDWNKIHVLFINRFGL